MFYITGDLHGEYDIHKLSSKRFPMGNNLTRDDYLIICGDFGLVWNNGNSEMYWRDWLNNKPWTTLFVDGNHENFPLLNRYPITKQWGGKVHQIEDNIYHLMRGQVFEINGKTFLQWAVHRATIYSIAQRMLIGGKKNYPMKLKCRKDWQILISITGR